VQLEHENAELKSALKECGLLMSSLARFRAAYFKSTTFDEQLKVVKTGHPKIAKLLETS
jgi:hypothetical protein